MKTIKSILAYCSLGLGLFLLIGSISLFFSDDKDNIFGGVFFLIFAIIFLLPFVLYIIKTKPERAKKKLETKNNNKPKTTIRKTIFPHSRPYEIPPERIEQPWTKRNPVAGLVIIVITGPFGIHKFLDNNKKTGFVYLFTLGLFGVGWFVDIIKQSIFVYKAYKAKRDTTEKKDALLEKYRQEALEGVDKQIQEKLAATDEKIQSKQDELMHIEQDISEKKLMLDEVNAEYEKSLKSVEANANNFFKPKSQKKNNPYSSTTCLSNYVVMDFETTGLSPQYDFITEIAAVIVENSKIVDTFNQLIKPKKQIPDKVVKLTGITNEMVSNAPSINIVLPKFMDFIGDNILVGHNIKFDSNFLSAACQRFRIPYYNKISDTLELSRRALPTLSNYKLATVCKKMRIKNENAHRAMSDVLATQQVFERLSLNTPIKICSHPEFILKPNSYHVTYTPKTKAIQELQTLLIDITSDDVLTDDEVLLLKEWLNNNDSLCGSYPFDKLKKHVENALEDGILEQSELNEMLAVFNEICKPKFDTDISPNKIVNVSGKTLVLTGEFKAGNYDELNHIFDEMGAVVRKTVSGLTDFLIVGDYGSPDWSYGYYGNNIAKARELQESGKKIIIINESDFFKIMYSETTVI